MRFLNFMDYFETTDEFKEHMSPTAMEALGEVARRCRTERDFYVRCRTFYTFVPPRRFCGDASRAAADIEDMLRAAREEAACDDLKIPIG